MKTSDNPAATARLPIHRKLLNWIAPPPEPAEPPPPLTRMEHLQRLEDWATQEPVVFITGVPRTGTSRFYDVIARVPEFKRTRGEYSETHLMTSLPRFRKFREIKNLYKYLGKPTEEEDELQKLVNVMQTIPKADRRIPFIRGFFYCAKKYSGMKRLVEKTPSHCMFIHELQTALPRSKFFFMVRHPVNVYASMRRRMKREMSHQRPEKIWRWMKKTPAQFATFYRRHCEQYLAAKNDHTSDVYLLRYEDLCADPHQIVSDALAWLGIEFDEAYLQPRKAAENRATDLIHQPIQVYDRPWQEYVEQHEADEIQDAVADLMQQFRMDRV